MYTTNIYLLKRNIKTSGQDHVDKIEKMDLGFRTNNELSVILGDVKGEF